MTIILRQLKIKDIPSNSVLLLFGINLSGKSFLTKDILSYFDDIPIGTYITENKKKNNLSIDKIINYIPPIFLYEQYDKKIIKKLLNRQKMLINEYDYDIRSFVILDEIYKHDKYFKEFLISNKNLNYLSIFEYKILPDIKQYFIENIDYLFILKNTFEIDRKMIYNKFKKYIGVEYTVFTKILDDYTEDYYVLVIDLKCESKCIEDKFYWYKASKHNNFKICDEESWNYSNKNYIIEPPKRTERSIFY